MICNYVVIRFIDFKLHLKKIFIFHRVCFIVFICKVILYLRTIYIFQMNKLILHYFLMALILHMAPSDHLWSVQMVAVQWICACVCLHVWCVCVGCVAGGSSGRQVSSMSETKAHQLMQQKPVQFMQFNQSQLSRIYPSPYRVDSSNFNPQPFWNAGCHLGTPVHPQTNISV